MPPAPPRPPRRISLLTPLTLFALLALIGLAVLTGTSRPGVVAAIALCVVGGVLSLSSFIGRARGLTVIGLLIAIPLVIGLAAGPRWGDWGDHTYRPVSAIPSERSYERGAGTTELDLRDLRFSEIRTTRIELDQLAGDVIVRLPDDTTTDLSIDVGAGDIDMPGDFHDDGLGREVDRQVVTGDGRHSLDLEIDLLAGRVEVHAPESSSTTSIPTATTPTAPTTTTAPTTSTVPPTTTTPALGGN
jgi:hypothetical protein